MFKKKVVFGLVFICILGSYIKVNSLKKYHHLINIGNHCDRIQELNGLISRDQVKDMYQDQSCLSHIIAISFREDRYDVLIKVMKGEL